MLISTGGSDTMFADAGTAACTSAYDIPPSIAAKSSPHRKSHDAAFAARANASGSAISSRLCRRPSSSGRSATTKTYPRSRLAASALLCVDIGHELVGGRAHLLGRGRDGLHATRCHVLHG